MFHLNVRYISKGTGQSAARAMQYITRTGPYQRRGDSVRIVVSLNMPYWGQDDVQAYWQQADSGANRVNARTAYMIEFALPKALAQEQQSRLAVDYATELARMSADSVNSGFSAPATLAIHEGHGRNPHVHLMLSPSIRDGIERTPGLWFMRHNAMHPERGGAPRSRFMTRKSWLLRARELWAEFANKALVAAGHEPVMDHRSKADRGIPAQPAVHLGPLSAHLLRHGKPTLRIERYKAIQQENRLVEELQSRIEQTRKRLVEQEKGLERMEFVWRRWQVQEAERWHHLLDGHALAGNADAVGHEASVFIVEAGGDRGRVLYDAAADPRLDQKVLEVLAPVWMPVRTPAGLWLLRPNEDSAVLVGPGYVVTDASDPEAVNAVLTVASHLPYEQPVVGVCSRLASVVVEGLAKLGKAWRMRTMRDDPASGIHPISLWRDPS